MDEPIPLCAMCDKPGTNCLGCRNIKYCSPSCQQADWPLHKIFCKKFNDFYEAPYPQCERAIYFPNNGKVPFFIWLAYKTPKNKSKNGEKIFMPHFTQLLGNVADATTKTLTINPRLNRKLSHTIAFSNRDTCEIDDSVVNEAVAAVSNAEAAINWKGPIVVYGLKSIDGNHQALDPLDTSDFVHIVDYLKTYSGNFLACEMPYYGETVPGIKINCLGDRHTAIKPRFEDISVPITHPVFTCPASPITSQIDIPILAIKSPTNPAFRTQNFPGIGIEDGGAGTTNSLATYLHLDVDSASDNFGMAPMYWQNKVGNVIAVRADKKPLLLDHLDAITRYCQFVAQPAMARYKELKDEEKTMSAAIETEMKGQISKTRFKTFFEDWRACQDDWEQLDLVSPYEVEGKVEGGEESLPGLSHRAFEDKD